MAAQSSIFGNVIYSYTRRQAIDDGVLVDLTDFSFRPGLNVVHEAGIKYPIAMTSTAFACTVQKTGEPLPPAQDLSGRIWDVLTMFKFAARAGGSEIRFTVRVLNWVYIDGKRIARTKHEDVQLKAVCGPGDDAEPVITIMLPDED